ncbi:hypothetical protein CYY_008759 [Polysphondylium violaceum]|uniref:FNIP repeat-containing protein n=1 Tax=Polysphondylium violaceum TaxID=133409 RepID=A0A8J4PPX4_9MYCE|nr:hypothetical protein CYY_008759 [Polysphondylium violaceum]
MINTDNCNNNINPSSYLVKDDTLFITQDHAHQFEWSVLKTDNCNNNSNNNNSHNDIKQLNILVTEQYDHDRYAKHIKNIVRHIPDTITTVVITYSHNNSNNSNNESIDIKRIIKVNKSILDLQYKISRLLFLLEKKRYLISSSSGNNVAVKIKLVFNQDYSVYTKLYRWSIEEEMKHCYMDKNTLKITDTTSSELLVSLLQRYDDFEHKDIHLELDKYYDSKYDQDILDIFKLLGKQIRSIKVSVYKIYSLLEQTIEKEKLETSKQSRESLVIRIRKIVCSCSVVIDNTPQYLKYHYYTSSDQDVYYFDSGKIPIGTKHLICNDSTVETLIPFGIKRITLTNQSLKLSKLPNSLLWVDLERESYKESPAIDYPASVQYICLTNLSRSLADIKFPRKLKYLCLGKSFGHFLYGNAHVPSTVTHLEVQLDYNQYANHWLYFKGTLPKSVTHLKITQLARHTHNNPPFLIPSSVQFLDICNDHVDIKIIDQQDYYKDPISSQSYQMVTGLESIGTNNPDLSLLGPTLRSLSISKFDGTFDIGQAVSLSITSLYTMNPSTIPLHIQLNYLEYSITEIGISKIVFLSNDRSITIDRIPIGTTIDSFKAPTKPFMPIEELVIYHQDILSPSLVVKKLHLKTDKAVEIPESVQVYESSTLPINYPQSLEQITICPNYFSGVSSVHLNLVPSTVKHITLLNLISSLSPTTCLLQPQDFVYDKYQLVNDNNNDNNSSSNIEISQDSFFKIWKNNYLQSKIYGQMTEPELYPFRHFTYKHTIPKSGHFRKLREKQMFSIPSGVNYFSIEGYYDKYGPTYKYPQSFIKFRANSEHDNALPSTVKHLVIGTNIKFNIKMVPSFVEIVEFKNKQSTLSCQDVNDLIELSESGLSLKRVILSPQCLVNNAFISQKTLDCLNQSKLVNQVYQIYDQSVGGPISPSTTILIWRSDSVVPVGLVPFGVRMIVFGNSFNQVLIKDSISTSVTEIYFGGGFKQCFSNVYLPVSLKYLTLSRYSRPILPNTLSPNITQLYIKFCEDKCKESLMHLPKSIKYLQYNQIKLKRLHDHPSSTNFICRSIYSNDTREHIFSTIPTKTPMFVKIPTSTTIDITMFDNYSILPGSLDHLNINIISFDKNFNQALPAGSIPYTVSKVLFPLDSIFNQGVLVIPPSVTYLHLGETFNQPLTPPMLPSSLQQLFLSTNFNQPIPINLLPVGLKVLFFGKSFNQTLEPGIIPNTVEELYLYQNTTSIRDDSTIPHSVTKLHVGHVLLQLYKSIPSSVKHLCMGWSSQHTKSVHPLEYIPNNTIPSSITTLTIHTEKIFICDIQQLPPNIKSLCLYSPLFSGRIPPTIDHLQLKHTTKLLLEETNNK